MAPPTTKPGNNKVRQEQADRKPERRLVGEGFVFGNLVSDPELRFTPTGKGVAKIRVVMTKRVQDEQTREWKDTEPEYYDVQIWGQQAERTADNLSKGDRVIAHGLWYERDWEDREGKTRTSVELTAHDVGPSLLFADVRVKRAQRRSGGNGD